MLLYLPLNFFESLLLSIIRTLFDGFDIEREGKIHINQLSSLLTKMRKPKGTIPLLMPSIDLTLFE